MDILYDDITSIPIKPKIVPYDVFLKLSTMGRSPFTNITVLTVVCSVDIVDECDHSNHVGVTICWDCWRVYSRLMSGMTVRKRPTLLHFCASDNDADMIQLNQSIRNKANKPIEWQDQSSGASPQLLTSQSRPFQRNQGPYSLLLA